MVAAAVGVGVVISVNILSAEPECGQTISQAQAEAEALVEAVAIGFANATVTDVQLLTAAEYEDLGNLGLIEPVVCVWWVTMSGSRIEDSQPGDFQIEPAQFTEMSVAVHAGSGYSVGLRLLTDAVYPTPSPLPTNTAGPSPAPSATPTASGAPP
jgi:hypothetical protein